MKPGGRGGFLSFKDIDFRPVPPSFIRREEAMKQSEHFLENAENCAQLAERANDQPTHQRYKRMEAAWRALAEEQDWLDGEVPPDRSSNGAAHGNFPP
jgi:hypothetical protein